MRERTVPVHQLDVFGVPQTEHALGAPLVKIRHSWQEPYLEDGKLTIEGLRDTWALIDTGADVSLLADRWLSGCGPAIQEFSASGIGGRESSSSHQITLLLPPADIMIRTIVTRTSSIPPDCIYQMILGRNFLMTTRFTFDGPNGIQALTVLDDSEREGQIS